MLSVEIFQCYQLFENSLTLDRLWCFDFLLMGKKKKKKTDERRLPLTLPIDSTFLNVFSRASPSSSRCLRHCPSSSSSYACSRSGGSGGKCCSPLSLEKLPSSEPWCRDLCCEWRAGDEWCCTVGGLCRLGVLQDMMDNKLRLVKELALFLPAVCESQNQ